MPPNSGRGRGGGGGDGEASPEWLPPLQRRQLEASRASPTAGGSGQNSAPTRVLRSRIPVYNRQPGHSQEFLNRPDVRAAAGLGVQAAQDGGGEAAAEGRGRIAMVLRRQQGDVWAPGRLGDQAPAHQDDVDIEGVPVALVEEQVEAEVGDAQGEDQPGTQPPPPAAQQREEDGGQGGDGDPLPDLATQPPQALPARAELPSLEVLHTTLVPTLKWCPKAARGDFARELTSLWHQLASNPDDVRLWVLESMFARCILPAGRGPRAGDAYSQARLVRERLRRWRAGEHAQLWLEAVDLTKVPPKKKGRGGKQRQEEKTQEQRNAERATTLAQDGQFTKALQALTSAGMAPPNRANFEEMKEKHPEAQGPPLIPPTTDLPQISFSQAEVEKAARRFRRGSAPGPSGLRPEHLLVTLQAAPGRRDRALQGLTQLTNTMARGGVPEEVAPYLAGARLHAAKKKRGGLRPIAVGNMLRRLVGKCCATKLQEKAAGLFKPHQLGVGVRSGCEAIIHSVRQLLEADPSLWCLQADFINAFNLVDRREVLSEVLDKVPEILAWVATCYGQPSHLLFGPHSLSSQNGVHQGDPLASLLFSLVLHHLVSLIQERVPGLACNVWFLDDGTLVGNLEDISAAVDILVQEGPARGLILSTTSTTQAPSRPKSTIWCPSLLGDPTDPSGKGLARETEEGIVLLGAPLGSEAFVAAEVEKKVEKVKEVTELLPLIEDPHTEFALLRSCLSLPKLSFLLRAVDTSNHTRHLQTFDRVTREGLGRVLGVPLGDKTWQQAKLPVSMGGMGLRAAEDQAPAAHAASVLSSQLLVQDLVGPRVDDRPALSAQLLAALSESQGAEATEADLVGLTQRMISLKVDEHQLHLLQEQVGEDEVREKARLASLSLPHSGDWLNCAPLRALGLHLRSAEFVLAAKFRLGLPIFDREGPCPSCFRLSDIFGDHALCCGVGGERISRHNALRDAIYDTAVRAGLGPIKEGRFLLPGADRRPADVLLPHWDAGRDGALDVTVVHPFQDATLARAATEPGYPLNFAHDRKMRGAEADCRQQGISFIPLVAESMGGWHSSAEKEVKKLGSALARHTGQPEGEAISHLWGRLGILLQRGNVALMGNRVPSLPEPEIDGIE